MTARIARLIWSGLRRSLAMEPIAKTTASHALSRRSTSDGLSSSTIDVATSRRATSLGFVGSASKLAITSGCIDAIMYSGCKPSNASST